MECLAGVYRKIHLFRLFDEHKWLGEGEAPTMMDLPWGRAGLSICYDLRFPELFRRYAVEHGAELILICAEWPLVRVEHWRALLIARAIENQCFVAATNSCGDTGGTVFGGHSMIVDPWGAVIAEAGEDESLVTAEVDLGRSGARAGAPFPFLKIAAPMPISETDAGVLNCPTRYKIRARRYKCLRRRRYV